jgi:hypothetical protein
MVKTGTTSKAAVRAIFRQGYPRASICVLTSEKLKEMHRLYVEPCADFKLQKKPIKEFCGSYDSDFDVSTGNAYHR